MRRGRRSGRALGSPSSSSEIDELRSELAVLKRARQPAAQGQKRLSVIAPFPHPRDRRPIATFDRRELTAHPRPLRAHGRRRPLARLRARFDPDVAVFAAFRRAAERPEVRIEKRPELRLKQGAFALVGEHGLVLKRGHELARVLAPLERRLMRLVG